MKLLMVLAAICIFSAVNCSILSTLQTQLESVIENVEDVTTTLQDEAEGMYTSFVEDLTNSRTASVEEVDAAQEEAQSNSGEDSTNSRPPQNQ